MPDLCISCPILKSVDKAVSNVKKSVTRFEC
jgi:hypothetical protein